MQFTTPPGLESLALTGGYGIVTGEASVGTTLFRHFYRAGYGMVSGCTVACKKERRKVRRIVAHERLEQSGCLVANAAVKRDINRNRWQRR